MRQKTGIFAFIGLLILPLSLHAQPFGAGEFSGPEEARHPRGDRRLEAAAAYLELTEGQHDEWEAILEHHRLVLRQERQELADLQRQFRELAEVDNPDLAQLGNVALAIHRRSEAARGTRSDVEDQLASILTPDQIEKFEALQSARDTIRPRGERRHPHRRARPDSDSGGS